MKALLLLQNELIILKVNAEHWKEKHDKEIYEKSKWYFHGRLDAVTESIERLEEIIKKLEDEN